MVEVSDIVGVVARISEKWNSSNVVQVSYREYRGWVEVLKMLRTDKDVLELAKIGVRDDMVELYVVHKSGFCRRPCTIEEIEVEDVVGSCKGSVGPAGLEEGSNGKAQKLLMGKGGIEATKTPIGDTSDGPVESL
ncbi:hypothetical protein PIB30_022564 [Stylosanthes scabra]|uniref:Uncharacterized protein n=1 Tax=Stylosanthes scabra TaxID=79078 RepID=A0ABU6Y6E3_9FABA|nr:hypothetical protein [Stylosanthes scabra]